MVFTLNTYLLKRTLHVHVHKNIFLNAPSLTLVFGCVLVPVHLVLSNEANTSLRSYTRIYVNMYTHRYVLYNHLHSLIIIISYGMSVEQPNNERGGVMDKQITLIGVHSTMHLVHHKLI